MFPAAIIGEMRFTAFTYLSFSSIVICQSNTAVWGKAFQRDTNKGELRDSMVVAVVEFSDSADRQPRDVTS